MAASPTPSSAGATAPPAGPGEAAGRATPATLATSAPRPERAVRSRSRIRLTSFVVGGLAISFALAFFVSPRASTEPDGLDKVAIDHGLDRAQKPHVLGDTPTAGYALEGVDDHRLSTGLAGLIGVTVTFLLGAGLIAVVRRANGGSTSGDGADGNGVDGGDADTGGVTSGSEAGA